ncbi:MAG: PAS domain S-box protein [Halobacteriota archaeon]
MGTDRGTPEGNSIEEDGAFLRALVANTSEGLLTIDENSRIIFANPAIESILGYRPEELIGSVKMKIIPERLRDAHETGLDQHLRTGEKHVDWTGVDLPALHKDGHEVPVSVSLREHEYDGERLFTGIFTDITERKQREKRLREQTDELKQYASVLSHDLRNPLAVAKGYVAIERETNDSEELQKVDRALDRIDEIIEDTLSHALHGKPEDATEKLSLCDLIRTAWDVVVTHDADLVLPEETWMIRAQKGRVHQLVENPIATA